MRDDSIALDSKIHRGRCLTHVGREGDSFEGALGEAPSLHRNVYAHGNPLRYRDPSGRCGEDTQGALACVQEDAASAWSAVKSAWNEAFPDSDAPTGPDEPRRVEVIPNSGVALVDFDAPSRERMRFQQKWYRSLEQPTGTGGMSVMLNTDEKAALETRRNVEGTLEGTKVAAQYTLGVTEPLLMLETGIGLARVGAKVVVEASVEKAAATAPERLFAREAAMKAEAAAGSRGMNGLRASRFNPVTAEQQELLKREFVEVGGDPGVLRFNQGSRTGFVVTDEGSHIQVAGDVFPAAEEVHPRSTMSTRAVLGHERGHSMFPNTELPIGAWNDEFRASYWAAKNAPGLSFAERTDLMRDALLRAEEAGVSVKPNPLMKYFTSGGYSPAPAWWKPPAGFEP